MSAFYAVGVLCGVFDDPSLQTKRILCMASVHLYFFTGLNVGQFFAEMRLAFMLFTIPACKLS